MTLPRILLASAALSLLVAPSQAQEKTKPRDPAIECGAFFAIMTEQSESAEDSALFSQMSTLLFSVAEGRLESMGVSAQEQERIGGEAVTRMNEQIVSGDVEVSFTDCHEVLETAIDTLMPDVLSKETRELLICGSQFVYSLQSGEFDDTTNADFQTASEDQFGRAQALMEKAGVSPEEQEQVSGLYGLSVGMVLGMGEEPLVSWDRCGEV